jgi:hypothetical protein
MSDLVQPCWREMRRGQEATAAAGAVSMSALCAGIAEILRSQKNVSAPAAYHHVIGTMFNAAS